MKVMDVRKWKENARTWMRQLVAPVLALALVASFVTYEFVKPAAASAPKAAPAAAPLDVESVGALLALDKAMETLAARVTPAVVNVTVASKAPAENANRQLPEDRQQYFGQSNSLGEVLGPRARRPPQ